MTTTTAPAFTEQDVLDLAALVGPALARLSRDTFASPAQRLEAAVALAEQDSLADAMRTSERSFRLPELLAGTYDEFRAEALARVA